MALQIIRTSPATGDYTPLEEHQAQTPGTFFGGKPVLHYHAPTTSLSIQRSQLENNPAFSQLQPSSTSSDSSPVNGDSAGEKVLITNIDVWATSSFLILFSLNTGAGVQIPYPIISLHAQQGNAVYMQLTLNESANTADEDLETLELLITPTEQESTSADQPNGNSVPISPSQALYTALSACADLHPDPNLSDDEDAMESSMPGAGGWITSENMHEFMDEDGNMRIPDNGLESNGITVLDAAGDSGNLGAGLGAGAGTIRTADEFDDADEGAGETGYGVEGEGGEETKWRRTG